MPPSAPSSSIPGREGAARLASARFTDAQAVRFRYLHLWLPLMAFIATVVVIGAYDLDLRLARALYDWQGDRWSLKRSFVTEALIHRAGRNASIVAWLGVVVAWAIAMRRPARAAWRAPLGYLCLAVLTSTLLVSWIKSWSNVDCPWDIQGLGGVRPHLALFEARPPSLPHVACFPAGHASGGYAWMALYFFFAMIKPQWRLRGLAAGVGIGMLFGVGQQLRGAHFLSHDIWTAAICWFVSLGLYLIFVARMARRDRAPKEDAVSIASDAKG